jgi:hypothetical protein
MFWSRADLKSEIQDIGMSKGCASGTPAEKGAEFLPGSLVLQRPCSTSCLACSGPRFSRLVGGRDLGVILRVFHSHRFFPQPEPSISLASRSRRPTMKSHC